MKRLADRMVKAEILVSAADLEQLFAEDDVLSLYP
jgi:hypothetical protein